MPSSYSQKSNNEKSMKTDDFLKNLNFYINRKPGLRDKLLALGSPPSAHTYMPNEVELIIHALGQPYGKIY